MPFLFEKKEHKKDAHEYIEITGFDGTVADLVVPKDIDGIQVEAIGNHSFSGRQDLKSVTLPESIKTLYGFAFHNCRNLKKISLFDSIDDYYDGVCRQCDSLSEIDITINRGWFEVIRNFLADNDKTLHFTVRVRQEGSRGKENRQPSALEGAAPYITSSLTFPEYVYDFSENTMARTIQFSIAGSGMFYRECVDRRSINYREYDKLFEKARIDGGSISEDIAVGRLLYPVELDDRYRSEYEQYVKDHGKSILTRLVEASKEDGQVRGELENLIKYSAKIGLFLEKDIDSAISHSVKLGLTEVSAILMESSKGNEESKSANMRFEF